MKGFLGAVLLGTQNNEEVARLSMVALGVEDMSIAALGIGKLPALVKRGGLIQFREVERP